MLVFCRQMSYLWVRGPEACNRHALRCMPAHACVRAGAGASRALGSAGSEARVGRVPECRRGPGRAPRVRSSARAAAPVTTRPGRRRPSAHDLCNCPAAVPRPALAPVRRQSTADDVARLYIFLKNIYYITKHPSVLLGRGIETDWQRANRNDGQDESLVIAEIRTQLKISTQHTIHALQQHTDRRRAHLTRTTRTEGLRSGAAGQPLRSVSPSDAITAERRVHLALPVTSASGARSPERDAHPQTPGAPGRHVTRLPVTRCRDGVCISARRCHRYSIRAGRAGAEVTRLRSGSRWSADDTPPPRTPQLVAAA